MPSEVNWIALLLLLVVTVGSSRANVLTAGLSLLDQSLNANPIDLVYYWPLSSAAGDTSARTLNVAVVFSAGSSSAVPQLTTAAQISIVCSQSPTSDTAFAALTFVSTPLTLLSSPTNVQVPFTIQQSGRMPYVTCAGTVTSFTVQTTSSGLQLTSLVITPSLPVAMKILTYPTISFSQSSLSVSPFTNSYLTLFLRDPVVANPISVTCSLQPSGQALSFDAKGVASSTTSAAVGAVSVQISYFVNSQSLSLAATYQIVCTAQSTGPSGIALQYQQTIASNTVNLAFVTPQIILAPNTQLFISGSAFSLPLQLYPNKPSSQSVTVECGINTFQTISDMNAFQANIKPTDCARTYQATPSTLSGNSAPLTQSNTAFDFYFVNPSNSSSRLKLIQIKFQDSTNLLMLPISRWPLNAMQVDANAYLSVLCCDATSLAPIAGAVSAANTISFGNALVSVAVRLAANIGPSSVLPTPPSNVQLLDPGFSVCPCALIANGQCNPNCCCDTACKASDVRSFSVPCPATRLRAHLDAAIDRWTCNDMYGSPRRHVQPDWFPLLCINSNLTTILGRFHSPSDIATLLANPITFANKLDQLFSTSYSTRSSFVNDPIAVSSAQASAMGALCTVGSTQPYSSGVCLQTASSSTALVGSDVFRFPQLVDSLAKCVYSKPVRFLTTEGRSFCTTSISQELCVASNAYIGLGAFTNQRLFRNPAASDHVKLLIGDPDIEYYKCANFLSSSTATGSPSTTASASPLTCTLSPTTSCTFSSGARLFDTVVTSDTCDSDTWTYSAARMAATVQTVANDYYALPDTGDANCVLLSAPPSAAASPTLTAGAGVGASATCQNAVVAVKHLLLWSSGAVVRVLTRVILADVKLSSTSQTQTQPLTQMFETRWHNLASASGADPLALATISLTAFDQLRATSARYADALKSGAVAYTHGQPLITGYLDPAASGKQPVSTAYYQRVSTYASLNGNACGTLSRLQRGPVRFGYNASGSCAVQVTRADLSSPATCQCMRRLLFKKLNDYFAPANQVSSNGAPNSGAFVDADWVSISAQNGRTLASTVASDAQFASGQLGVCASVPTKVTTSFLYEHAGKLDGEPIYQIVGAYVSYSYSDWAFTCQTSNGECATQVNNELSFNIEYEVKFLQINKKVMSWMEQCKTSLNPSAYCVQQVLWTWPTDPTDPLYFDMYYAHLGLIFAAVSFLIVYLMVLGWTCPC